MIYHLVDDCFVSEKKTHINALDLGLLRGYGVFDYVQLYQGKPFHLLDHLQRLKWSAEQIELPLSKSVEEIEDLVLRLIAKNPSIDAGIRLLVTGGLIGKDSLLSAAHSTLLMLFQPFVPYPSRYYTEGMRVVTTNLRRMNPCVKATDYIPAVLAMKKACRASFDDALYLNCSEELLEATTSNLFFFKKGKWITAKDEQVVNGVTRSIFLKLIQLDFPIEFRALHISEIGSCEEAFLCSSVKDAIPLVQIDDKIVGNGLPGSVTTRLRRLFHTYLKDYFP